MMQAKSFINGIVIILLLRPKSILACDTSLHYDWYRPPTQYPSADDSSETERLNLSKIQNAVDRNIKNSWDGWTVPPEVERDWREWLLKWEKKNAYSNIMNPKDREELNKHRDSNWPFNWGDLGKGQGGVEPPPWAYAPINIAKPTACLKRPKKGKCKENHIRWGYNPYLEKCMSYVWSGCGGSRNKFDSLLSCQNYCEATAAQDCQLDSGIPIPGNFNTK